MGDLPLDGAPATGSRRRLLQACALALPAGVLAAGSTAAATKEKTVAPRTFVLVHGAWHGGWCWQRVSAALEAQGHKVYTPTLTGLADRSHLIGMPINLDTHIADIANLFKWEDIQSAVLVGHSYGGWPVSGALEQIADRVSTVVFLDAFLPKDGQSGFKFRRPEDEEWVRKRMTAQPIGVSTQPIKLTGARDRMVDKFYLRALHYPNPIFDRHLADCKAEPSWKTGTFESGHDVMIDAPDALISMLSGLPA
jgi:pimeloyl-ACP methyl ester carboxylesterase